MYCAWIIPLMMTKVDINFKVAALIVIETVGAGIFCIMFIKDSHTMFVIEVLLKVFELSVIKWMFSQSNQQI